MLGSEAFAVGDSIQSPELHPLVFLDRGTEKLAPQSF